MQDIVFAHKKSLKKNQGKKLELDLNELNLRIPAQSISDAALTVIKILKRHGHQAYIVGGAVRDLLINKKPKDFDVATSANPQQVLSAMRSHDIRAMKIGRRFIIVHAQFGNEIIEITTFRQKFNAKAKGVIQNQSGLLVSDNNFSKDIASDVTRRDFTINALYYDPIDEKIIDFYGGIFDIIHQNIDIIGDPKTRYQEDPVRMIRALRFKAKLNFNITKRTADPILKLRDLLKSVSPARLYDEIGKIFLTGHGLRSFECFKEYHFLEEIFIDHEELLKKNYFNKLLISALQSTDARYKNDQRNRLDFFFASALYPKLTDTLWKDKSYNVQIEKIQELSIEADSLQHYVHIVNNITKIAKEVIDNQKAVTLIPYEAEDFIISVWTWQFILENIAPENLNKFLGLLGSKDKNRPGLSKFRAYYDFLVIRSKVEPYLQEYLNIWRLFYENIISKADRIKRKKDKNKFKKNSAFADEQSKKDRKQYRKERRKEKMRNKKLQKNQNITNMEIPF